MALDEIRGVVLPLPTVFDRDGNPDEDAIRNMTSFYVDQGVHSFFLLGSFGMGPAMDLHHRKQVAAWTIDEIGGRVPSIVHIGAVDHYSSIELGLHARDLGAEAVGIVGPYYYADRTQLELELHFRAIDSALSMPLFLYNNPAYQGYPIDLNLMRRLTNAAPRIFGAKLSQSTLDEALEYVRAFPDLKIYVVGSGMMPGMTQGVRGFISPALSMVPELAVGLVAAIDRDDVEGANSLNDLAGAVTKEIVRLWKQHGRVVYAEGLRALGLKFDTYPRWPTPDLPEDDKRAFLGFLDESRASCTQLINAPAR